MLNKVMIIGNVGQDPEIRAGNNGSIANVTIATSEKWKDKSGSKKEKIEWHRVVFFGRLAEIVGQYVSKGSKLYVEGKITTRKWQDKTGQDRYTTEIVGNQMTMLDSRGGAGGSTGDSGASQGAAGDQSSPQVATNDFDDDIPFR